MEAMAMALPVISTPITGIPEIVDNGINGILVPPNDEHTLAKAMLTLIKNPDMREQLGRNARKQIEIKFDIQKNIQQYLRLFS
jgi:glycosyltransferase involved in cell wall biosynthesis